MKLFSVPADFRTETIDRYAELNKRYTDSSVVVETYGNATVGLPAYSGRPPRSIPPMNIERLREYISYCRDRGIDFNYTFNASCLGNSEFTERGLGEINELLGTLWGVGVRHLTISLPQMMTIAQNSGLGFTIKVSTICQINSAYKAEYFKRLGVDRIVIDEDITRDFRRIRQITEAFGEGVEMIANSMCVRDCPLKMFHYNRESHASSVKEDLPNFFGQRCAMQKSDHWANPLRINWTRPEDLGYYEACGVHRFKLQGRQGISWRDPARTLEAYMTGHFDGDLWQLLSMFDSRTEDPYQPVIDNRALDGFLEPFFYNPNHCTSDCERCGHCEAYAEGAIGKEKSKEMLERVRGYYEARDPFKTMQTKSDD